ncbi:hypothetical protein [Kineosporia sp. R_H_3]|uniref:hypothetical protein n=1 Tax=Kineosporia sp. R_H_3 TaxID=1961848 RepID=UPI000B4B73A2|nr:hypothetical protein [Kineosporia sp. R_H_3]
MDASCGTGRPRPFTDDAAAGCAPVLLLHEQLRGTRAGRRWERIARAHRLEIEALAVVHPDLGARAGRAIRLLAAVAGCSDHIDDTTLDAVRAVLDDLDRLGTFELRRDAQSLRDELAYVRGHSFAELITG